MEQTPNSFKGSPCLAMLYTDNRFAWLWLILRVYVGYAWITAGWDNIKNSLWF
jgi:thiosulfate dehydrogenase [quinone] large subunit